MTSQEKDSSHMILSDVMLFTCRMRSKCVSVNLTSRIYKRLKTNIQIKV